MLTGKKSACPMDSHAFLHLEHTAKSITFLLCSAEATGKACWMTFQANILTFGGNFKAQKNFHQLLELVELESFYLSDIDVARWNPVLTLYSPVVL